MVTKTTKRDAVPARERRPAAPSRRRPEPAPAAAPASAPDAAAAPGKPNLLRAGLKALGNVRDDVVQQRSRVFEAILGIDPSQRWANLIKRDAAAPEALDQRKFEAVFDQRVASALARIGMPSIEALQALKDEVAALRVEVRSLKSARRQR